MAPKLIICSFICCSPHSYKNITQGVSFPFDLWILLMIIIVFISKGLLVPSVGYYLNYIFNDPIFLPHSRILNAPIVVSFRLETAPNGETYFITTQHILYIDENSNSLEFGVSFKYLRLVNTWRLRVWKLWELYCLKTHWIKKIDLSKFYDRHSIKSSLFEENL